MYIGVCVCACLNVCMSVYLSRSSLKGIHGQDKYTNTQIKLMLEAQNNAWERFLTVIVLELTPDS
jgi:hypothetical protein